MQTETPAAQRLETYRIAPHPLKPEGFALYLDALSPSGPVPTGFVVTPQGTASICAERARYFETAQDAETCRNNVISDARYHCAMGDSPPSPDEPDADGEP
jgi:hypothetical protein